jgi:peptidylprolyl isomerase
MTMAHVAMGDTVRVHYVGKLPDGAVFGTTSGGEPIEFVVGSDKMIPALSDAMVGMQPGEEKTIHVDPERAFGPRREELQQRVARSQIPPDKQVGDRLIARQGDQEMVVWIRDLDETTVVVDGNHPLAGQTLTFELKLVDVANVGGAGGQGGT